MHLDSDAYPLLRCHHYSSEARGDIYAGKDHLSGGWDLKEQLLRRTEKGSSQEFLVVVEECGIIHDH